MSFLYDDTEAQGGAEIWEGREVPVEDQRIWCEHRRPVASRVGEQRGLRGEDSSQLSMWEAPALLPTTVSVSGGGRWSGMAEHGSGTAGGFTRSSDPWKNVLALRVERARRPGGCGMTAGWWWW